MVGLPVSAPIYQASGPPPPPPIAPPGPPMTRAAGCFLWRNARLPYIPPFDPKGEHPVSKLKPVLIVVLDGWGIRAQREANAIAIAGTPCMDALMREFPWTAVKTSGLSVGLPEGQMGNSEVGHTNLGAGRIVYQDLVRINRAVEDGSFFQNEALLSACRKARAGSGAIHFLGLLSDGGVHSHITHLFGLLRMAKARGATRAFVHCFLDGRDVPPDSGAGFVAQTDAFLRELGVGRIATVMGRYYAMDRDNRWERVRLAYEAMVLGLGRTSAGADEAVSEAYGRGETDEFVVPTVVVEDGRPVGSMKDGDSAIFFNFRTDRTRELTRALALDGACLRGPPGRPPYPVHEAEGCHGSGPAHHAPVHAVPVAVHELKFHHRPRIAGTVRTGLFAGQRTQVPTVNGAMLVEVIAADAEVADPHPCD